MKRNFSRRIMLPFLLAISLFLAGSPTISAAQWFSDVPEEHMHYEGIKLLTENGIISGYPDNTFKPEEVLKREHGAVLLSKGAKNLASTLDPAEVLKKYKDIDENSKYAQEIAMTTEAGIFNGDQNGYFNPKEKLTREQTATILVKAFSLDQLPVDQEVEINLSNIHDAHKKDVQILANLGITKEVKDFHPKAAVTRGEFSAFIERTLRIGHFNLSIMHMNDTHARVAEMPKAITAIKDVREKNPEALLLHAGDAFAGTLYFTEFEGRADMTLMNLMGIDAMAFGNHEFDLGDSPNGHQSLAKFIKGANFSFIGANIDFSGDKNLSGLVSEKEFTSSPESGEIHKGIIKEIDGERVGIFGLTTESTAFVASPKDVKFDDYIESAQEAVAYFEEQGINKIVAVSHIGFDSDPAVGNDLLLAKNVPGIDIIVGGHSHTKLNEPVVVTENIDGQMKNPTVIVQADSYLTNLGTLDVEFDEDGVVYRHEGKLIPLGEKIEDVTAKRILRPFEEVVKKVYEDEIGATLEFDLPNPRSRGEGDEGDSVRANETALGNLITDGMLSKAKEYDEETVIAFQNGGGIRTDMKAGPVTIGAIMEVLPFGNTLSLVTLTGDEIKKTLEHSVHNAPSENGGFLHVSGMKFAYDSSKPVGERIQSMEVFIDDEYVEIKPDEKYRITTNAFTARGGDGFEILGKAYEAGAVQDLGLDDWINFRDHMIQLGTVAPKIEGRIIDLARVKD